MSEELGARREKYWNESAADEKIERTRREVKSLQSQIESINRKTNELLEHLHCNGQMVIPLNRYGRAVSEEKMLRGLGKDEVYF